MTSESGQTSQGIYWERRGSGPYLTLVIGFGQDSSAWQFVATELENDFTLILIDNRGAGRSPNLEESFSLDDLADDVIGVLTELGIPSTAMAGQSMGGAIAQLVALRRPDLVSHLILLNSFAQIGTAPRLAFEAVYQLLIHNTALDDVVANLNPWIYSGKYLVAPGRLEQLAHDAANNPYPQPVHSYRAQLDALTEFNSLGRLRQIGQPTLVIGGNEDLVAPAASVNALHAGIADSTLKIVDSGHASHIEVPAQVADEFRNFLSKSDA